MTTYLSWTTRGWSSRSWDAGGIWWWHMLSVLAVSTPFWTVWLRVHWTLMLGITVGHFVLLWWIAILLRSLWRVCRARGRDGWIYRNILVRLELRSTMVWGTIFLR